jgi:tRNA dimethylallyltransferase
MDVLAVFGPTAVGKTGVSLELADLLRKGGEDPVAVNCDSIQVYEGLGVLSGAASAAERERLEHRLVGFVPANQEFSAGRFAELAHAEIDRLRAADRRPLVVGGTGLYLRAALADLELRPPVPAEVRERVEREIATRGAEAVHAELPAATAEAVHPNDRKRVARMAELHRSGMEPHLASEGLWTRRLRLPTTLVGLTCDRDELDRRIARRVEAMIAAGAAEEARRADRRGASRTARAAIGFEELLAGDVPAMEQAQRRFARRQLTWMRRTPDVRLVDRSGRSDREVALEIVHELHEQSP